MARLCGDELLAYLAAHEGEERSSVIMGAGYVREHRGREMLEHAKFYQAIAEASGHNLGPQLSHPNLASRQPSFRLKVGTTGIIQLAKVYSSMCEMKPGTYVTVKVEGRAITIEPEAEPVSQPSSLLAQVA